MDTLTHRPRKWRAASLALASASLGAVVAGCQSIHRPMAAPTVRGPVIQSPLACADFTVSLYFESESSTVTPQAAQLLSAAQRRAKGCNVTGINVVGLADAPGAAGVNLALSKRRADAVTRALHRVGFTTVAFQVAARGDAGAETGAGQERPLRRRADVQFHLAAPPSAPAR